MKMIDMVNQELERLQQEFWKLDVGFGLDDITGFGYGDIVETIIDNCKLIVGDKPWVDWIVEKTMDSKAIIIKYNFLSNSDIQELLYQELLSSDIIENICDDIVYCQCWEDTFQLSMDMLNEFGK